jgi:hypothetical protein
MGVVKNKTELTCGLNKFSLGSIVRLMGVQEYIDPSVFETFKKALATIEGMPRKELTRHQMQLANMIIREANDALCVEVLYGRLQETPRTQWLDDTVRRYESRMNSQKILSDERARNKAREARRVRFAALAQIAAMCSK